MTEFDKKNYMVIKEALEPDIAKFVYNYFLMKRQVVRTMLDIKFISPFVEEWGVWNDEQAPGTYSHYGDIAMETLLVKTLPIMEKHTGMKLIPTYSYARIYKNGDVLARHKDRFSCEISTTMNLGGDSWPIYLEPSGEEDKDGIKVTLKPGDMLVYKGGVCEHWREPFEGEDCGQVFLHYNSEKTEGADKNAYDSRPHLGLPSYFKELKID
jgi:hypothetical protein